MSVLWHYTGTLLVSGAVLSTMFAGAEPAMAASVEGDRLVLARLGRIARGEWHRAVRPSRSLRFAIEIRRAARRHRLSSSLLAALVRAESAFDPRAVSSAGACGLGQLMPKTARELEVYDVFDPEQNLDGSARYLSAQIRRFGSARLALAAYHAGPERVASKPERLPRTTREYIARVLRFEREYRWNGLP